MIEVLGAPPLTCAFWLVRLLRKQEASENLLAGSIVNILLEFKERLNLIFRQPDCLQVTGAQSDRKVLESTIIKTIIC